ncbi:MAG: hypothetical protein K0S51_1480 [Bacillales bacterium]|jgi:hypothetical protein|nr:hypothetical protein [Bacillales bacterium]
MNNTRKISIIILLLIVFTTFGFLYYSFSIKTFDIADKNVDEIVNSKYDIKLPEDDKRENVDSPTKLQIENKKANTDSDISRKYKDNETLAESIIEYYQQPLDSLQVEYNKKVDLLVATAISEYKDNVASGENKPFAYYYRKYNLAAKRLEAETDETFSYIYSALQGDLKRNGLDPEKAELLKENYETMKDERETALINKAKDALLNKY